MRLITLLVLVVITMPFNASADILNVPGDYPTIQEAINNAIHGDTVLVDSGTYEEVLNFSGKDIMVKSANGPEVTIIDAEHFSSSSVVTFQSNESSQAVLEGFTLINGTGTLHEYEPGSWALCGGGIFIVNASPTIIGNIICNNHSEYHGAGLFIQDAVNPVIKQNRIRNNSADGNGGGIFGVGVSSLVIEENEILQNTSESYGGIMCIECNLVLSENMISENESKSCSGVFVVNCQSIEIVNNEILKNSSEFAVGGIKCTESTGNISNNTISGNTGGGIHNYWSTLDIIENVISENTIGGGIDIHPNSQALIKGNIITGNHGDTDRAGGINTWGDTTEILHNIIYANTADYRGGGIRATNSGLIEGNYIVDNVCSGEGGGIWFQGSYNGQAAVKNNTIRGNSAESGGGVCCRMRAVLSKNCIAENIANERGGGVFILPDSEVVLRRNEIRGNQAMGDDGGGVFVRKAKAVIVENTIYENEGCDGGGIYSQLCNGLDIINNTIIHNTGKGGGGVYLHSEYLVNMIGNTIHENNSSGMGGGVFLDTCYYLTITDNMIYRNEAFGGGGIFLEKSLTRLVNNTLFENLATMMGGGVLCFSSGVKISNHILWSNQAPEGKQIYLGVDNYSSVLDINHSNVKGGLNGVFVGNGSTLNWNYGMKANNPQFVDSVSADLHLLYTSPCRDTGSNDAVESEFDLEGDVRISGNTVDMGADEFHMHLYCVGDFTPQGAVQAKILGEPGSSPNYLAISGMLLAEPLNLSMGTFYLDMPWILVDLMSTIPTSGLLQLSAELPRLPEAPYDLYMQALVAGKLTNLFTMEVR